jgi:hypothetical protein
MKSTFASIAAITVVLAAAGCRRPQQTVVVDRTEEPKQPSTVVIDHTHVHSPECGHFYYNGHWYSDSAHVHIIE